MPASETAGPGSELGALLQGRQLIIATNRGPVEFYQETSGRLSSRRGPGGVVTALAALANQFPLSWVATTMTEGDNTAFPNEDTPPRQVRVGSVKLRVRYVPVEATVRRWHYDEISNNVLWFLQHYLWDPAFAPTFTAQHYQYWDEGYRRVNNAVARAVVESAHGDRPARGDGADVLVLLQDYHLYLAAQAVRAQMPRATIEQFVHIPWPAVRYWEFLPERMLLEIYESLAANDVLGFQTRTDVLNFLNCAHKFLGGGRVDFDRSTVHWRGHRLLAQAYPIPVDPAEVRRSLNSAATRRAQEDLGAVLADDGQVIVRVDRMDPTKNIVRGFEAYEMMLRRHEELHGKVRFLAFLVPSRERLPIYRRYDREVRRIIKHINDAFGTHSWRPITAWFDNNRPRALAAMRRYDALLVNPNIDGMNLVAKEGPIVNERDGVLILSRTAGAYTQLADAVLPVTPTDLEETAEHLYEALVMSERERHRRAEIARAVATAETPAEWAAAQIRDALASQRSPSLSRLSRVS